TEKRRDTAAHPSDFYRTPAPPPAAIKDDPPRGDSASTRRSPTTGRTVRNGPASADRPLDLGISRMIADSLRRGAGTDRIGSDICRNTGIDPREPAMTICPTCGSPVVPCPACDAQVASW